MKKKKLYLTAFLLVLALALQGGIFSGFSVPVQAAATSKKQTGFVKKNGKDSTLQSQCQNQKKSCQI